MNTPINTRSEVKIALIGAIASGNLYRVLIAQLGVVLYCQRSIPARWMDLPQVKTIIGLSYRAIEREACEVIGEVYP